MQASLPELPPSRTRLNRSAIKRRAIHPFGIGGDLRVAHRLIALHHDAQRFFVGGCVREIGDAVLRTVDRRLIRTTIKVIAGDVRFILR